MKCQSLEVGALIRFKDKRKGKPKINQGRIKGIDRLRKAVILDEGIAVALNDIIERVQE